MDLGRRLRQARLEAGLSQRQLCGTEITRNMLSQIENGSARPSVDTLTYLAAALGKPVSFFLEEDTVTSPNQAAMEQARETFSRQDYSGVIQALKAYRTPDATFDGEYGLLLALSRLRMADQAIREKRIPYARQLLEQAGKDSALTPYYTQELEHRRLLLLAKVWPEHLAAIGSVLPDLDEELLVRSRAALEQEDIPGCVQLLGACRYQNTAQWHMLRGEAAFRQKDYVTAARHYHQAESEHPEICWPRLESCYRELEDYKKAYEYACKQR